MPEGPRGEKRPADVIGAAMKVTRIATGEETEELAPATAGAALGRLGGQTRAKSLTPERKAEIAKTAAQKGWNRQED